MQSTYPKLTKIVIIYLSYLCFALIVIFSLNCLNKTKKEIYKNKIVGNWVPMNIEWDHPKSVDPDIMRIKYKELIIFSFYNNSKVALINANVGWSEDDSLNIQVHYTYEKGKWILTNSDDTIKLTGKNIPDDTLKFVQDGDNYFFTFKESKYKKTRKLTNASIKEIKRLEKSMF